VREIRICVDVDDLERGIAFYRDVLGLRPGRRLGDGWVELLGASSVIDLLAVPEGSKPLPERPEAKRSYARHWTPVHLDFVVDDIHAAVRAATDAGATLDREIQSRPFGLMANLADPFGHGICLLQMNEKGYDALLEDVEPALASGD
jgi:predicted enzyme related to lactoylglutathione lyase